MRILGLLLLLVAAWSVVTPASAQSCGTVLSASITLAHDMDCTGYPNAFKVVASGVTINLNGWGISGEFGAGIVVADVRNLTIRGPGRIENFRNAIYAERSDYLSVTDVVFEFNLEAGIALINSRYASLQRNSFHGYMQTGAINVRQPLGVSGAGAGGNFIAGNTFDGVVSGINICGADAGGNRIYNNSFANISNLAVRSQNEAADNWIDYNKFRSGTQVAFVSSSHNTFQNNVFERGSWGLGISAGTAAAECVTRGAVPSPVGNRLLGNKSYRVGYPFRINEGSDNRVGGNAIEFAVIGISFGPGSSHNDATGNTYPGTGTPVSDLGVGNIH